ncbi:MAG: carboxypeptidase-like regulatory domain-containing protein [Planctomycetota bacterium]
MTAALAAVVVVLLTLPRSPQESPARGEPPPAEAKAPGPPIGATPTAPPGFGGAAAGLAKGGVANPPEQQEEEPHASPVAPMAEETRSSARSIRGYVQDVAGNVLAGISVGAMPVSDEGQVTPGEGSDAPATARTDRKGYFTIRGVSVGRWQVRLLECEGVAVQVTVSPNGVPLAKLTSTCDWLDASDVIHGVVVGMEDQPVAGAWVVAFGSDGDTWGGKSDLLGRFAMGGCGNKSWTLQARRTSKTGPFCVSTSATASCGQSLTLRMSDAWFCSGQVLGSAQTEGVEVWLHDGWTRSEACDASGSFQLGPLCAGAVSAWAFRDPDMYSPRVSWALGSEDSKHVLRLVPAAVLVLEPPRPLPEEIHLKQNGSLVRKVDGSRLRDGAAEVAVPPGAVEVVYKWLVAPDGVQEVFAVAGVRLPVVHEYP